jgi:hypothetical protein
MALDNPQLVDFCNTELRQIADKFVALKIRIDSAHAEYNQRNLGTIINDGGSSNPVLDGSLTDGRTIATGGDVFNIVTLMTDMQAFLTAGRVEVLYAWQVNGVNSVA